MASMSTVRLTKGDSPNWGFRLQGGKDFGTPLVIQKVNGGSPAERAGLIAGDAVIKINNVDVYNLLHKEAQDVIVRAGSSFEMVIQRGGSTWKPSVIPTGTYSKPSPSINNVSPVTKTSLAAQKGENIGAIGTGHNLAAKPFSPQVNGAVNGAPPKLVNKQYNSPLKLYSEDAIAETISAQSEVLSTGALGVNFKKNEKDYDATNSAVYRMLKEAENDAPSNEPEPDSGILTAPNRGMAGLRHVEAPQTKAAPSNPQLPPGQNVCADCERLIVGVFVRIKDKNLHVECFKCATCGSSLKNVGYYNINNKLYCDIHAKSAAIAINNPAAVPIIPAGVKAPVSAISSALSGHSLPSPSPLSPKTPSFAPSYPPPQERPDLGSVVGDVAPQTPNQTHDSNPKSSSNSSLYNPSAPVSFSKFINKPSTFGGPKPFSSVSAPLSPGGALNRGAPLSPASNFNKAPLSPPIGHSKSPYSPAPSGRTTNIIWPPPQDSELATACPLFYPPPSRVEAELEKKLADKRKTQFESDYFAEDNLDETMSFYSEEMSFTGRRSAAECVEILSETLDTQKMIETALKATPHFASSDCCQNKEFCDLKRPTEYQPNTVESQLQPKVENAVPQKWESSLTQAVRTTAPDSDTFCRIPSRTSASPMASALSIAPAQPFTPLPHSNLDPVPLPEETEPYFPPEHPIIPAKVDEAEKKEEKKRGPIPKPYSPFVKALEIAPDRPFTPVGGGEKTPLPPVKKKPKDPLDQLLDELPKANERLDMRTALTTAPERPYTPLIGEQESSPQPKKAQLEKHVKPEELPASFRMNAQEPKPPSYYAPAVLEERIQSSIQESSAASERMVVEKETIQPAQVTHQVVAQEVAHESATSFAPIFQGFTCSFKNKTDHSQFSVEVSTTPPVPTPPPKPQTPISYIATVEEKPACIRRETIIQEKRDQKSKHVEQVVQRKETIQRQAEEVIQVKPAQVNAMLHKPQSLPGYQKDLQATAEADLILMERKRRAEERIEEQRRQAATKPIITIEPSEGSGDHQSAPAAQFNAGLDSSSRGISPRPRSITPSMISKAPPLLPYYQDNLVPHFQSALETNVFDPAHPEISRSPSPHPGKEAVRSRSPSPFPGGMQERSKSPAEGPPPNPLHSSKPLPTPQDSRIRQAKESLQSYLPEYKSKRDLVEQQHGVEISQRNGHVSQNVAYPADGEFGVRTGNVQQVQQLLQVQQDGERFETNTKEQGGVVAKTSIHQKSHEEQLSASNKTQSQTTEVSADGMTHVQRRKVVTEEYEHSHKENNLQIEKSITTTTKHPFARVNAPVVDPPNSQSFHITNPHHVSKESSRLDTQATLHQASQRLSAQAQVQPPQSAPAPPIRKVFAPGSLAPIKHVAAPSACVQPSSENVTKPNVPNPDVGAGAGRQAGGVTATPKRGRGLVNAAALPGSRVPLCGHCHGQIRGPFITALGKIWCPQHFTCNTPSCKRPLQDLGFVEEQGQLYCEYCFEQYLAPPCSKCNGKIKGDCLRAIGKNFHPECFNCVYCGKLFGNNPFFLEDGNPYCDADWNELFTTKCFACGFPVEAGDRWVEALNNNYHSQCFNCTMCKKNLEGQSFFAKGGRPFCKTHAR
ncbi:PDZ and LIM domain protein Zasp isoform X2 [Dendroctonus ponderosae]|uniref:PDZ and LIM domain protein Zasp isoform X2 n=1 Tax=Dendroctonus ponderosae TaxID=77166 RepID=UPI002034D3F7|nr:PDZ and LIM domain protein Zasp isoform X2 [Dendroctonus ponderosae]